MVNRGGRITVRGSRAGGYGQVRKQAKYQCAKCRWAYEEPEAGGTVCPHCGCKYVQWINPEEFIARAEKQDAQLALDAANALRDAEDKVKAAFAKAKKNKGKRKAARKQRKRK